MIPGSQSKLTESTVASATTVSVKTDLVRFTGAVQVETITSPLQGLAPTMILFVVSTSGALVLGTAGNILVGQTLAVNRVYMLVYSKTAAKWYIHGVV
jgi:hypothetical protein